MHRKQLIELLALISTQRVVFIVVKQDKNYSDFDSDVDDINFENLFVL